MLAGFGLASMASAKDGPASQDSPAVPKAKGRKLSHDESLKWIEEHKAWKLAKKTRPIWARPVEPDEDGKEFQTADHVKQVARKDSWLCVGSAGEPWFQALDKIEGKYEPSGEEVKSFRFDTGARTYKTLQAEGGCEELGGPGERTRHRGILHQAGLRPGVAPLLARRRVRGQGPCRRPLSGQSQGCLARAAAKDVWLVQQPLFESTYSIVTDRDVRLRDREPGGSRSKSGRSRHRRGIEAFPDLAQDRPDPDALVRLVGADFPPELGQAAAAGVMQADEVPIVIEERAAGAARLGGRPVMEFGILVIE